MKNLLRIVTFLVFPFITIAQVGVGNTNPQATLDISATNTATPSNTDGILIPRVDEFPAANPTAAQDGMLVFATGNGTPTKGFYYWNNTTSSWDSFSGTVDADWYEEGTTTAPTSNSADIFTDGNVGIGTNSVSFPLQVFTPSSLRTVSLLNSSSDVSATGLSNIINESSAATSGATNGIVNSIGRSNQSSISGVSNSFQNSSVTSGFAYLFGYQNSFGNSTSNITFSLINRFQGTTNTAYGMSNLIGGTMTNFYGVNNTNLPGAGPSGDFYGLYNFLTEGGAGEHYGVYTYLSHNGAGDKYGEFINIPNSAGGVHYGLYADVQKANSYAAYLIGRTSLGNGASDRYLMPAADGTNGQVMTTNGSGVISFQDATGGAERIDDLLDGKSDNDGSQDGSSIFLGLNAGQNDDSSNNQNVGIGFNALSTTSTGFANVAVGWGSLTANTANSNTAYGYLSANGNSSGANNTAIGRNALVSNSTGDNNTSLGSYAGFLTTGSGNVFLGANAGLNEGAISNKLFIENSDANENNALIYGDFGADNTVTGNILRTNSQFQIGNPSSTGYSFPTIDGMNGQVLTTDGSGNVTFQDSSGDDADWYVEGTTNTPSSINDDIFTQGNVAIGKNTADYPLDIETSGTASNPIMVSMVDNNSGPGDHIGLQQSMNGSHSELVTGIETAITNSGSGLHTAFTGFVWNGAGNQLGMRNTLRGNAGDNTIYSGSILYSGGSSNMIQSGVSVDIAQPSSQITYGLFNVLNAAQSTSTGRKYGVYNLIDGGSGNHYGVLNDVRSNTNNTKYGTYNQFGIGTTNTGGVLYGTYNDFGSSITSNTNKYGTYTIIPSSLLGTHYGIYSDVRNPNGFAGYFIGRTSFGNAVANRYIMPPARGTNGQIMQTDGAGNVTWADPSSGESTTASNGLTEVADDIRLGGTLTQATTITHGINTLNFNLNSIGDFSVLDNGTSAFIVEDTGDIGISVANPVYKLDISETGAADLRAVNITKTDNSAASTFGTYITKTAAGAGRSHAQYNVATSTGTGYSYGVYNDTGGSGTGQKYGVFNEINTTAAGSQYGVRNWLRGNTTANQFGTFNNMDSNASGDIYGLYNGMRNTGGSSQMRGIHNEFSTAGNVAELTGLRNQMSNGTPGAGSMNGVYNDFSNANNGNFIGSRTEFTAAATGVGSKFGTYNLISATAGGIHYGTYNSVSPTNGWAGYFLGKTYVSNKLGIGTGATNPDGFLEVRANNSGTEPNLRLVDIGGSGARIQFSNTGTTNGNTWTFFGNTNDIDANSIFNIFHDNTGNIVQIRGDGDFEVNGRVGINADNPIYALQLPNNTTIGIGQARANAYTTYSDSRIKFNQTTLTNGLSKLLKMRPKTYFHYDGDMKDGMLQLEDTGEQTIGFIAQELYEVLPEAVQKPEDESISLWSVNYDKVIPVAVKAIQELNDKIESLEAKNKKLEAKLEAFQSLEARILALENSNSVLEQEETATSSTEK